MKILLYHLLQHELNNHFRDKYFFKLHIYEEKIQVINGKGGKDADVPISSKLAAIIAPFAGRSGLLVPESAVPLRSDKAIVELKIAVKMSKASGEEISHHKLRHSFASELLRKGVNPEAVKELMRHSGSMEVLFKHYAHVQRGDLKEAVELL